MCSSSGYLLNVLSGKEYVENCRIQQRQLLPICQLHFSLTDDTGFLYINQYDMSTCSFSAAKNGVYTDLVNDVRHAFERSILAKVNCRGLEPSDYKKIGAKLMVCLMTSFARIIQSNDYEGILCFC